MRLLIVIAATGTQRSSSTSIPSTTFTFEGNSNVNCYSQYVIQFIYYWRG